MKTRTLALTGLSLYVLSGAGAFFVDDIWLLLVLRALMGVSVGMIMPLSTGLLAYYFPPEEQAGLMGLSAAMNQMGGVVATFLAGMLAGISWNYAFLVYLLGLIAIVLVTLFLPNERLHGRGGVSLSLLKRFHPSVVGMFLVMVLFFIYPTNFALTASGTLSEMGVTLTMVGLDVVALLVGLCFGALMKRFASPMKYVAPLGFAAGYHCLAAGSGIVSLLAGSALIGIANGIGVPYLNTIGSVKAGKEAATTVMPLLSAALYLGQFLSPLIVSPVASAAGTSPYTIGVAIALIYILQAFLTRKKQILPGSLDVSR
jgi:MFS family permease